MKVTFLGAVALNLAVVIVAVSDTLLYFIATAQNHIQRVTKRLRVTCFTRPAFSSPTFSVPSSLPHFNEDQSMPVVLFRGVNQ